MIRQQRPSLDPALLLLGQHAEQFVAMFFRVFPTVLSLQHFGIDAM
jgi:hypothetical protein